MTALDRRVRVLGRLIRVRPLAGANEARLVRMQARALPRNRLTDWLLGGRAEGAQIADGKAQGGDGLIAIRTYRPSERSGGPLPLVVNFHGGGWVLGNLDQSDWLCSHVARDTGAVVVSVDYRLAPTYRWPAAVEDCYAAYCDLVARAAEFGADPARTAVMGESAGGNLAAVVAMLARDRSGLRPTFQALLYPATDLTLDSPSIAQNAHAPILDKAEVLGFRAHYLCGQDPADPLASPLLAPTHEGLSPALVQVAEHDPIRDDGVRYAEKLRAAGVRVTLSIYEGSCTGT